MHRPRRLRVLNASRHHRPGSHQVIRRQVYAMKTCSTPRGITAPGHRRCPCAVRTVAGAQRLAASPPRVTSRRRSRVESEQRSAQRLAASPPRVTSLISATAHPTARCSTPRGITAPGHHVVRLGGRPESCAQRLAASPPRVTAFTVRLKLLGNVCSTPRGITAPGHFDLLRKEVTIPAQVLNASRHHRPGSRPGGARARPCFRGAQRLAASPPRVTLAVALADVPDGGRCSTPRGITAPGHRVRGPGAPRQPLVLNASRHHRPGSPRSPVRACTTSLCAQRLAASPPRVTSACAAALPRVQRAQRLAASPPRVTG